MSDPIAKPRLLIVDDDPLITDTLHFVLSKDFEVFVAESRAQVKSLLTQLQNMPQLALDLQHAAGLVYVGSALGVIFAGDFFSFFIFWEMLTVASVFLIWARRTRSSLGAGFRYLLMHAAGGVCLLAGILLHVYDRGSPELGYIVAQRIGILPDLLWFWPALRLAASPCMADGCLSSSDRYRDDIFERLYDKDCGLCFGKGLSWHRGPHMDRSNDDRLSHFLCRH